MQNNEYFQSLCYTMQKAVRSLHNNNHVPPNVMLCNRENKIFVSNNLKVVETANHYLQCMLFTS